MVSLHGAPVASRLDHRRRDDPATPRSSVRAWPQDNTWTIQMELHDNLMLTRCRGSRTVGRRPGQAEGRGRGPLDISDPVNPKQLSHWKTAVTARIATCTPAASTPNLAATCPLPWQILVILDVSDPKNPKEADAGGCRAEGNRAAA